MPRWLRIARLVYWAMMAVALVCILVLRRPHDDVCIAILLAATAFGIATDLIGKRGMWG